MEARAFFWRRVAVRIVLLTFSLAASAVAAEHVARFATRRVHSSRDERAYLANRNRPTRPRNSLGFREREIGVKHAYRIAVIGDSFTWGVGLKEDERFSDLIGAALGSEYEVLNFGVLGANLPGHLRELETALTVSPDFVLLQLFVNDWETRSMRRPEPRGLLPWQGLDQWFLRSSVLYGMLQEQWMNVQFATGLTESYPHYMQRYLGDPRTSQSRATSNLLHRFIRRSRAAGVQMGIVLFPDPSPLGEQYAFGYLHDRVRATCDAERLPCVDLRPVLADRFGDPHAMWVSRFDRHPNARVNRLAAAAILSTFTPFWCRRRWDGEPDLGAISHEAR